MQPGIERAARDRAEERDGDLRRDQQAQGRRPVGHQDEERKAADQQPRNAGRDDGDLAPLAELLDERDGRQLRHLRKERHGGEHADVPWRRAQLYREAHQDDATIQGADEARPRGVLHQHALAALDVVRRHYGVGWEMHPH